jgi:hypothetical protein
VMAQAQAVLPVQNVAETAPTTLATGRLG